MTDINTFMNEDGWDYEKMQMQLPQHVVDHVKFYINQITGLSNKPWRPKTSSGLFSVKSAWNLIRKREEETSFYKKIWVQGIPLKSLF